MFNGCSCLFLLVPFDIVSGISQECNRIYAGHLLNGLQYNTERKDCSFKGAHGVIDLFLK